MAPDQSSTARRLQPFTLGDWLVDPKACHISRGEIVVKLRAQLVDVLVSLARRAGEIVLKDEILAEVWPGQFIAESGLSRCIAELRQALQDDAQQPRYIETITKRGYRLVAPVVWLAAEETPAQKASAEAGAGPEPAAPPVAEVSAGTRRYPTWLRPRVLWPAAGLLLVAVAVATGLLRGRAAATALLTERDPVLLAFENRTGDGVFDDTIPLAVSIQLEQSPYLALLSTARVREVLGMMQRPADTPITRAVGLEVCERAGGRAVIVTSISRLGAQYVIGLEAVACGTGTVLARQQATTERKERVLEALQRAAGDIRLAVGESAASLHLHQVSPVEATTVSLDAWRAVRRGDVAHERGQNEVALNLYREAVSLDPDFAVAHSRLGLMALGDERRAALEKAYALRQRVTFPERLEIEAAYHRGVTFERARAVEALETLSHAYPRRAVARRDLANEYMSYGRYDAALAEAREALRLEPDSALNYAVVARAHVFLNQIAEGRQAAERGVALGGTGFDLHVALFFCGVASNDQALLARERAWLAANSGTASWLEDEAEESLNAGRLREAIGYMQKLEAWVAVNDLPDGAARVRLRIGRYEALCGLSAQAMRRIEPELRRTLGPVAKMDAVRAVVSAGRFDIAERLLNEIGAQGHPGDWDAMMASTYRAAVEANRGRTGPALDLLAPLEPFELGFAYSLEPVLVRAQTHYLAGDWTSARAAFEKILAHSTIDSARKIQPAAQLGLARTLARAGDVAGSRRAYEQFFERWRGADPGLPLLLDARREYSALR